jgi:DNA-binding beta-propeller fold protein YncE
MRTVRQLALIATVFVSLALAASAGAAVPAEFGFRGPGAGEFFEPRSISISQETGDVYIVDRNNSRVDSFGPEGTFRFAIGWGVTDGKNEFEMCTTACRPGIPGSGAGQFRSPTGVAVDPSGDFYVVDNENFRIQKFDSEGRFLLTFGKNVNHGEGVVNPNVCTSAEAANCGEGANGFEEFGVEAAFSLLGGGIAVDAAGNVYVGDFGRIEKFNAKNEFVSEWAVGEFGVSSIAINDSSELYVITEGVAGIHRYSNSGTEIGLPFDTEHAPQHVTVGPAGEVFASENEDSDTGTPNLFEFEPNGTELKAFDINTEGGKGIAFGNAIKRVYVLDQGAVRLVGVPPAGPFVVPGSEALIATKPTRAEVKALVVAEGSPTKYSFEYGLTNEYGSATSPTPLPAETGLFAPEAVSGTLTGLEPGKEYHFRVVAENQKGEITDGPDETFKVALPVLIEGESATAVTPESATLNVTINAEGSATDFHYEFGLSTEYGESAPASGEIEAGEAEVSEPHSIAIENLLAGTTYHYRVVAHNEFGTVDGPDCVFTTPAANGGTVLADGRVWEMVSPPQKHGAVLEALSAEGGLIQSSENGGALAYIGTGPLGSEAEPEGSQNISDSQFLARRSSPGVWETKDLTTPHDRPAGFHAGRRAEYLFFSNDLSTGFVEPFGETPLSEEATQRTPYLREATGAFVPMVTEQQVPAGTNYGGTETLGGDYVGGIELVGAAENGSSAVLSAPVHLTEDLAGQEGLGPESLYAWSATAHTLQLVSWLPGTAKEPQETPVALAEERAKLGSNNTIVRHAVSRDGERYVYEAETSSGGKHLYLRDTHLDQSVELDVTESGSPGEGFARFQDANSDDSVVYFTAEERLTGNATGEHNAEPGVSDLYRCEIVEIAGRLRCKLQDVTVPLTHEPAAVLGNIVGSDEDGGRVYFVANGRLTPEAVRGTCQALSAGGTLFPEADTSCNLYVFNAATNEVRLVAVLSGRDFPDWDMGNQENLMGLTARVSPNGKYAAFMSQRPLTGYDNHDASNGEPDEEVFEYDFESADVTCVSCKQSGARPEGVFDSGAFPGLLVDRPKNWAKQWLAASIPGWTSVTLAGPPVRAAYQSRYLSNNGRLFFDSVDDLVPGDVNGQFDVYEYEPSHTGSCGPEAGCVALMSSGQDRRESAFLDASSEGENMFFMSAAQLSPSDTDELDDIYDARVCTTTPDCPAVGGGAPPPCETSDACRAAPAPQPDIFGAPSSSTFSGAGNLSPAGAVAVAKAKPLPRARLLANALKACRKDRAKQRRVSCERRARKRYGPSRKARKASHTITIRKGGK